MALLNDLIIAFLDDLTIKLLEHINWHGLGVRILGSTFILFATHLLHNNIQNSHHTESLKDGWSLTFYQWRHQRHRIATTPASSQWMADMYTKHYTHTCQNGILLLEGHNCYCTLLRFSINMYTLRDHHVWDCLSNHSSLLKDNTAQITWKFAWLLLEWKLRET